MSELTAKQEDFLLELARDEYYGDKDRDASNLNRDIGRIKDNKKVKEKY